MLRDSDADLPCAGATGVKAERLSAAAAGNDRPSGKVAPLDLVVSARRRKEAVFSPTPVSSTVPSSNVDKEAGVLSVIEVLPFVKAVLDLPPPSGEEGKALFPSSGRLEAWVADSEAV